MTRGDQIQLHTPLGADAPDPLRSADSDLHHSNNNTKSRASDDGNSRTMSFLRKRDGTSTHRQCCSEHLVALRAKLLLVASPPSPFEQDLDRTSRLWCHCCCHYHCHHHHCCCCRCWRPILRTKSAWWKSHRVVQCLLWFASPTFFLLQGDVRRSRCELNMTEWTSRLVLGQEEVAWDDSSTCVWSRKKKEKEREKKEKKRCFFFYSKSVQKYSTTWILIINKRTKNNSKENNKK